MSLVVVGMADCQIARVQGHVLVTYALGSCIALTAYDPVAAVGGMLHFMLPDSGIDANRGSENPYKFADTGIPLLFRRLYEIGGDKRRMVVRAAGGAQMLDPNGIFDIGKRNYVAMRKILWKAGVLLQKEEIGGVTSRSVRMEIGTGRLWLRDGAGGERELAMSGGQKGKESWHIAS